MVFAYANRWVPAPRCRANSSFAPPYSYEAIAGRENMPVNWVSFFDALRFANWLHNGQESGDTESGAYTLLGGTATPSNGTTVVRHAAASVFVSSVDEWYKAAYYDGGAGSYFDYPAGTATPTLCTGPSPSPNLANCNIVVGGPTDVGSYPGSPSPSGTFDQGGNVWEWNESIYPGSQRGVRGGEFRSASAELAASSGTVNHPHHEFDSVGFRVARLAPTPAVPLLGPVGIALTSGFLAACAWRRIRRVDSRAAR